MGRKEKTEIRAGSEDEGRRIDKIMRKILPDIPLGRIYALLRNGEIRINGKRTNPGERVRAGDVLTLPHSLDMREDSVHRQDRNGRELIPIILIETSAVLVIQKPKGMLVHGKDSLEELVASYLKGEHSSSLSFTPGPLHRLDRNTSGLIVFSRSLLGAQEFSRLLRERVVGKYYLGLLEGQPPGSASRPLILSDTLERGVGMKTRVSPEGKEAYTELYPLRSSREKTLSLFRIGSGRTHQIRVQCGSRGYPLSGDTKYGGRREASGYILHSYALALGEENCSLGFSEARAPLPPEARLLCERLFGKKGLTEALASAERIIACGKHGRTGKTD
jgi:23S rRNA pseudouridine955/2504/2580 synthase